MGQCRLTPALICILKEIGHIKYFYQYSRYVINSCNYLLLHYYYHQHSRVQQKMERTIKAFLKGRYQYGIDEMFSGPSQNNCHKGNGLSFKCSIYFQLLTSIDSMSVCGSSFIMLYYTIQHNHENYQCAHTIPFTFQLRVRRQKRAKSRSQIQT